MKVVNLRKPKEDVEIEWSHIFEGIHFVSFNRRTLDPYYIPKECCMYILDDDDDKISIFVNFEVSIDMLSNLEVKPYSAGFIVSGSCLHMCPFMTHLLGNPARYLLLGSPTSDTLSMFLFEYLLLNNYRSYNAAPLFAVGSNNPEVYLGNPKQMIGLTSVSMSHVSKMLSKKVMPDIMSNIPHYSRAGNNAVYVKRYQDVDLMLFHFTNHSDRAEARARVINSGWLYWEVPTLNMYVLAASYVVEEIINEVMDICTVYGDTENDEMAYPNIRQYMHTYQIGKLDESAELKRLFKLFHVSSMEELEGFITSLL